MGKITFLRLLNGKGKTKNRRKGVEKQELEALFESRSGQADPSDSDNSKHFGRGTKKNLRKKHR